MNRKRLYSIDALRGLLALGVAYHHFCNQFDVNTNWEAGYRVFGESAALDVFLVNTYFRVPFFFVLSGFVMNYIYKSRILSNRISGLDFAVVRFSRLVPLCWFGTSVIHLLAFIFSKFGYFWKAVEVPFTIETFGRDLLFLRGDVGFDARGMLNGPEWTFPMMLVCYFLFFFYAKKFTNNSNPHDLLSYGAAMLIARIVSLGNVKLPIINASGMSVVSLFFSGCFICELWRMCSGNRAKTILTAVSVPCAVLGWWVLIFEPEWRGDLYFALEVLIAPATFIAILNFRPIVKLFSLRPLIWLGDLSISIWIMHMPVFHTFMFFYNRGAIDYGGNPYVQILVQFAGLFAVSLLTFRFVETPLQKFIRDKYRLYVKLNIEKES